MKDSHRELAQRNKTYTLATWKAQSDWDPVSMVRADGVYFWDANGRRYLDWSSQAFNVNIGHNNTYVIEAIQSQAARLAYAGPGMATEVRAQLGEMLAEVSPDGLVKSLFTLGGGDAVENALKMARMVTGRQKIIARYRAYHGATFGAMTAGGDPRRLANEPGVPWVVHVHDPYTYRSPLYRGRTPEEGDQALVDQIGETIAYEGPENIAAILLEGYSGASGIIQGGEVFWKGIQSLCNQNGILLIVDEVLSGFGRTGRWFGIDHYPFVKPDILVMAKGLTSGYLPLGAVTVSDQVASYFETNVLWGGLTLNSHPVSCAAAVANIQVIRDGDLVEQSHRMGEVLGKGMLALAMKHPSVGEVRGTGLHQVIELVRDRGTRKPLSGFNKPLSEPMREVASSLLANGLSTVVRWNWIFCAPPLIISEEGVEEGLKIIDQALGIADSHIKC